MARPSRMARPSSLLVGGLIALLVGAVAASDADAWGYSTPTPKPTKTPSPTKTPTPTPKPTKTPSPTNTPTPKPTNSPKPTSTPRPTGTAIVPPGPTPVDVCHHNCPDKIRWNKVDQLIVRTAFPIQAVVSDSDDLSLTLENANGVIYSASLQPGDLLRRGKSLVFTDRGAKKGAGVRGGIAKVKIQEVPKGLGIRVTIEAYGDLSAATDPTMTLKVRVGAHANQVTDFWQETAFGWFRFHN